MVAGLGRRYEGGEAHNQTWQLWSRYGADMKAGMEQTEAGMERVVRGRRVKNIR